MPRQPLLLLHGMGCGPWVWRDVVTRVAGVEAMSVTLAGHRGGSRLDPTSEIPATEQMVTDLERQLDAAGIERAHIVGNSLGGWLALRLAERGRALSVLSLAPAGGWNPGSRGEKSLVTRFALGRQVARRVNRMPALLHSPAIRYALMRPVASRASSYTTAATASLVQDLSRCQAIEVAVRSEETRFMSQIGQLGVPTKLVWSEKDRILGEWAKVRYRGLDAEVELLRGAGHMPMLDDPAAIGRLIEAQLV